MLLGYPSSRHHPRPGDHETCETSASSRDQVTKTDIIPGEDSVASDGSPADTAAVLPPGLYSGADSTWCTNITCTLDILFGQGKTRAYCL